MSEQLKTKISEFVDNELAKGEAIELLVHMHQQPELDKTLSHYQVISQVIKTGEYYSVDSDFSQRVSAAIDQEPTVLSPQGKYHNNAYRFSFAVAASVAVVAVIANGVMNAQTSGIQPLLIMTQQQAVNKIALSSTTKKNPPQEKVVDDDSGFEEYLQAHQGSLYTSRTYAQLANNE